MRKWLGGLAALATFTYLALAWAMAPPPITGTPPPGLAYPARRVALQGFTYQPPDWSPAAFDETFRFIGAHADVISLFMDDGVPWPQALAGAPWPASLEEDLARRERGRKPGQPTLLAINPVHHDRRTPAKLWAGVAGEPLPPGWAAKTWDDPELTAAYLGFVTRVTRRLKPDYLCYAFEVNSTFHDRPPAEFAAFLGFLGRVRDGLRREFPDLPLIVEVVLGDDDYMAPRWAVTEALFPYADLIGISTYPYIFGGIGGDAGAIPADWFARLADRAGGKPLAVTETGFLGADLTHPEQGVWIPGRGRVLIPGEEAQQAAYTHFLLTEANRLGFRLVNWWVWRDLDRLWEVMNAGDKPVDPMWAQWNHTGLQDAAGTPRAAQRIWDRWRALPRAAPPSTRAPASPAAGPR